MSDGKEAKRFQLGELLSKGEHSLLSEWTSAPDHDRIVAELRAEVERLKSKDQELVKCLQDLTGASNQVNPHLGVAAGVALMKAELADSNETIARQAREAEISKAVIEKLKHAHGFLMQCWNSIPPEVIAEYDNPLMKAQFVKIRELHAELAAIEQAEGEKE